MTLCTTVPRALSRILTPATSTAARPADTGAAANVVKAKAQSTPPSVLGSLMAIQSSHAVSDMMVEEDEEGCIEKDTGNTALMKRFETLESAVEQVGKRVSAMTQTLSERLDSLERSVALMCRVIVKQQSKD